jgi:hypothetical protein
LSLILSFAPEWWRDYRLYFAAFAQVQPALFTNPQAASDLIDRNGGT